MPNYATFFLYSFFGRAERRGREAGRGGSCIGSVAVNQSLENKIIATYKLQTEKINKKKTTSVYKLY